MKMHNIIMKKKKKYKLKYRKNPKRKHNSFLLQKLFFILSLIMLYSYLFINYKFQGTVVRVKDSIFKEIISFENNLNLSLQIFDEFRKINCDNKLIERNQKFKKNRNPDISVIITVFNQAYNLNKCLRSVQNQSIKNIEIIIVDDCSLDNSLELIKEYQKEDERIVLISHSLNEGTIKSRADSVRKARGKYITIIDGDDAFIHKDILKNSLYIAQKANLDVVEFRLGKYMKGIYKGMVYDYNPLNVTHILYQPELRTKFFAKKRGKIIINRIIIGKFIKRKVFKDSLNYIGSEFTDEYITDAEDTIMAVGLFHIAQSYYIMKELGYYYAFSVIKKNYKVVNNRCKINDSPRQFGFYYLIKFLVDKNNKTEEEKKKTYDEYVKFNINAIFGIKLSKKQCQIIFHVLNKFLEWDFLNQKEKENIIAYKNKVVEKVKKENITLIY